MATSLTRPTIGSQAPTVRLPDGVGNEWDLKDQRGHTVVLIFHRHIH